MLLRAMVKKGDELSKKMTWKSETKSRVNGFRSDFELTSFSHTRSTGGRNLAVPRSFESRLKRKGQLQLLCCIWKLFAAFC